MKITFWLLDINPKIDDITADLWFWGIDAEGNRVLVIDRTFTAYFYAVVKEGFDPHSIAKQITNAYPSSVTKAEALERRFFGKPVNAIKVCCKVATKMETLAKQLRSLEGIKECLEDDIRIPMRYLIDNNVAPCAWNEVASPGLGGCQRTCAAHSAVARSRSAPMPCLRLGSSR